MKYTGRLAHNNKIFDSNIDGKRDFRFRLGQGEVIKGWDEGIESMKVGGKRRLTIPPSQGSVTHNCFYYNYFLHHNIQVWF